MLKLHVSNGGRGIGQLELPAPPDEINRQLEAIQAKSQPGTTPTVFSADSPVPALDRHLQQTGLDSDVMLQKLNQLAG